MKPLLHSRISAKKFGGDPADYQKIHDWFDQTKGYVPDARHRLILHNAFGIMLCEQIFGVSMVNSAGKEISVRDIAEQHVIDDMGYIPTLCQSFQDVPLTAEVGGGKDMAKIKAGNFVLVD